MKRELVKKLKTCRDEWHAGALARLGFFRRMRAWGSCMRRRVGLSVLGLLTLGSTVFVFTNVEIADEGDPGGSSGAASEDLVTDEADPGFLARPNESDGGSLDEEETVPETVVGEEETVPETVVGEVIVEEAPLTYQDVEAVLLILQADMGRLVDRFVSGNYGVDEAGGFALPAERKFLDAQLALSTGDFSYTITIAQETDRLLREVHEELNKPAEETDSSTEALEQILPDKSTTEEVALSYREKINAVDLFERFERELISVGASLNDVERDLIAAERVRVRGRLSRSQAGLNAKQWVRAGENAREAMQALTRAWNVLLLHRQPSPPEPEPSTLEPEDTNVPSLLPVVDLINPDTVSVVEEWFDGNDWELITRDTQGAAVAQLTNNLVDDVSPDPSYRLIVWQSLTPFGWEIMIARADGTTELTSDSYDDTQPNTDGRFVVWLKTQDTGSRVWLYDRMSGFMGAVSGEGQTAREPLVNDGVVQWEEWVDGAWEERRFLSSELMNKRE